MQSLGQTPQTLHMATAKEISSLKPSTKIVEIEEEEYVTTTRIVHPPTTSPKPPPAAAKPSTLDDIDSDDD